MPFNRTLVATRPGPAPRLRQEGGFSPRPYRGFPLGDATACPGPRSRRGHRAPPRGVDVKATPAGPARGGPRGRKTPKIPFFRDFGQKVAFWPFFEKNALFGHFWPFLDPAAGVVLHQPLAAGPCTRPGALFRGLAGDPPFWGILAIFPHFGEIWGFWPKRAISDSGDPEGPGPPGPGTGPRREGLM